MKRVVLLRSNPVNPDPPVEKMANALLALKMAVTIVAWDRNSSEKTEHSVMQFPNGAADVVRFGIPAGYGGGLKANLKPLLVFQWRLFQWLTSNRDQYDIIHAFDFDTGFVAAKCAKMYHKKLVYHILDYYVAAHHLSDSRLGGSVEGRENKVIAAADATIICTEKRREQISGAKPKQLFVIHNTPDDTLAPQADSQVQTVSERLKLVFVGTLGKDRFLEEIFQTVLQREDVELHIGGFGELEGFVQKEAERCNRIHFYGKCSYPQTLALESRCDVMFAMYDPAIPNHRYSAPNKFYEALMLGKPIIMARDTGFDDIIQQENIGVVCGYCQQDFEQALDKLLKQREQWPEMCLRARKLYDEAYSWAMMESRISRLYQSL